jgi:hypothetical protein
MSASLNSRSATEQLAGLPAKMETNILRGAMKALVEVVADEARMLCIDPEVKASIGTSTRVEPGLVTAKVKTSGDGAYRAPWAEYGTDPHFISVDDGISGGRTIRRVNREVRQGSLVINGNFVGRTVFHPGESRTAYAFMRPAAQHKTADGVAAAGSYVTHAAD